MKKQLQRHHAARVKGGQGGFTLIELLIVIVILGILAAVVVFSVSSITQTGEGSACEAQEKTITVAIEAYRAQTGAYPAALADLVPGYINEDPGGVTFTAGTPPTVAVTSIDGKPCP